MWYFLFVPDLFNRMISTFICTVKNDRISPFLVLKSILWCIPHFIYLLVDIHLVFFSFLSINHYITPANTKIMEVIYAILPYMSKRNASDKKNPWWHSYFGSSLKRKWKYNIHWTSLKLQCELWDRAMASENDTLEQKWYTQMF